MVTQIMQIIDSMQEEPKLEGVEKEVAEAYVARINRKRIPIELKGEIKAKFKNEFHTIWQIVNGMQFANVAKYIIESICLHFATWGAYHLKDYIGMSDEEKEKMDSLQEEPVSEQNLSNVERIRKNWKEEPVSENLEEACEQLSEDARKHKAETSSPFFSQTDYKQGVIDGAKWKEEQFEKNRLAACDRQTEEEAEMERDFCMGIIENEHRQPTFDDAIKYGMRLQKKR
jgi:hypothetical protein